MSIKNYTEARDKLSFRDEDNDLEEDFEDEDSNDTEDLSNEFK